MYDSTNVRMMIEGLCATTLLLKLRRVPVVNNFLAPLQQCTMDVRHCKHSLICPSLFTV